jgi:glutamate racemase
LSAQPLGVFDSGLGGLSVVRALWNTLPSESILYFGDTGRFPYGTRSPGVIRRFARQNAHFLLSRGAKALVVACNTASAHALADLQQTLDVPVIGVVEPGVRAALEHRRAGQLGLIATAGTVASRAYETTLERIRPEVSMTSVAAPLFVALVEEGWTHTPATRLIAEEYLRIFNNGTFDALILGCTHFPLLRPVLREVLGAQVALVDGAEATAHAARDMLAEHGLLAPAAQPEHHFFVSDAPEKFATIGPLFLGRTFDGAELVAIEDY